MILINFVLMDGMIKVFDDFFFFCALVVVSYSASSIENDGLTRGGFLLPCKEIFTTLDLSVNLNLKLMSLKFMVLQS